MSRRMDPVSIIPPADVVRESLTEARRRVSKLAFLLGVAEGIEEFGAAVAAEDATAPYQAGRKLAEIFARKERSPRHRHPLRRTSKHPRTGWWRWLAFTANLIRWFGSCNFW